MGKFSRFAFLAQLSNLQGWRSQIVVLIAGVMTALALEPVNFLPGAFIGFTLFVIVLNPRCETTGQLTKKKLIGLAVTGWCFGFAYFVTGLWWLGTAMLINPAEFAWAIPLAILGLPAFLALYWALAAVIAGLIWQRGMSALLALGFAFGLCEWLRGVSFTGFPWNSIGYAAMPSSLFMQVAAILGLYGVNALAVVIFASPSLFLEKKVQWFGVAAVIAMIAADIVFGWNRLYQSTAINQNQVNQTWVRLVQPSIAQTLKIDASARLDIFDRHLALTAQPPAAGKHWPDLIIWPESAVPYLLQSVPEAVTRITAAMRPHQFILMGSVRLEGALDSVDKKYFNTIQAMDWQGHIFAQSDKRHLVPFGEYVPFGGLLRHLGLRAIADSVGGYSAGQSRRSVNISDRLIYLPLICYEIIFPTDVDYQGARANFIVNVTNDAWYGATPGPYQHFQQARVRAVELGIPLLRAANNGISAVVDPYGRIVAQLALNEVGVVDATLPKAAVSYWYSRPGNCVFFAILVVLLIKPLCGLRRYWTLN